MKSVNGKPCVVLPLLLGDPPPVSVGALPSHVGYALRRAQQSVFADFIRMLEPVQLRPGQFSVLTLIGENPGILQRTVCDTLAIKAANFVPLFAELERRQLTKRVAIDRRSNGLYLSAKGRTLVERATILCARHQAQIIERIGEAESRQLIALLFRLAGLEPGTEHPTLKAGGILE